MSDMDGDVTSKTYIRQTLIHAQFRYEIGRHVKTSRGHDKDVALPSRIFLSQNKFSVIPLAV